MSTTQWDFILDVVTICAVMWSGVGLVVAVVMFIEIIRDERR